jgi:2-iminobutanoate/2-iminopropanoate deaminase
MSASIKRELLVKSAQFPFSTAVGFGNLVFISGAIGRNPENGQIAVGDVAEQTRQTLMNLQNSLEEVGSSLEQVLKVTIFLTDMNNFSQMNAAYRSAFKDGFPARSCVEVSALPDKDALVEIEMIAGR